MTYYLVAGTTTVLMQAHQFSAFPTHLTMMKYRLGFPDSRSPRVLVNILDKTGNSDSIMRVLIGKYSGTSYAKISMYQNLNSNSSTAQRHKRVLTAYLAASKTSDEPSAAKCGRIIEVASLSELYLYRDQTGRLIMMPR